MGDESLPFRVFPAYNIDIINSIKYYVVEDEKNARRSLKKMGIQTPIPELILYPLNKHSDPDQYASYLKPALEGQPIGLISEAGCPGVADPGAEVVKIAHQKGIKVIPLVGPSSILLALMASGMNGQSFSFHGYLPIDQRERSRKIKDIEDVSKRLKQTQIFIETPFRNNKMLEDILTVCSPQTLICIASNVTQPSEIIKTNTVEYWRKHFPDLHKKPAIFLMLA